MYDVKPNLLIGFHGCDADVRNKLLNNPDSIFISKRPYDWLGHGMYFWENNYHRALQWAEDKKKRGQIETPAVIGAILYLGYCCDFLDTKYIQTIQFYYKIMAIAHKISGKKLPKNRDLPHDKHQDKIMRDLDCAAIEFMHGGLLYGAKNEISKKGFTENKIFDSTRGVFTEGGPAFEGAGIFEKSHIQICIRNPTRLAGASKIGRVLTRPLPGEKSISLNGRRKINLLRRMENLLYFSRTYEKILIHPATAREFFSYERTDCTGCRQRQFLSAQICAEYRQRNLPVSEG